MGREVGVRGFESIEGPIPPHPTPLPNGEREQTVCAALLANPKYQRNGRGSAPRIARHPRQQHLERVGGPGLGDEIVVLHLGADIEKGVDARHQMRREVGGEANAAVGELLAELLVLRLHQRPIGAHEERLRLAGEPVEIAVVVAVERVEQEHPAHALGRAADRQRDTPADDSRRYRPRSPQARARTRNAPAHRHAIA